MRKRQGKKINKINSNMSEILSAKYSSPIPKRKEKRIDKNKFYPDYQRSTLEIYKRNESSEPS